jgi:hypothetical protein
LTFEIILSHEANENYMVLQNPSKKAVLKAVDKTLDLMATNLRHRSLQTHEFHGMKGPDGEKIWESYAQNKTPGAYRVFWHYGPGKSKITIVAITPHP